MHVHSVCCVSVVMCIACSVCVVCAKYVCGVQCVCLRVCLHVLRGSGPKKRYNCWVATSQGKRTLLSAPPLRKWHLRKGVEGNHGWGRSCFRLHLFAESEAQLRKGRIPSQGSSGAPPPPQACSQGSNALAHFIHHPVYPSLSPASVGEERRRLRLTVCSVTPQGG